MSFSLPPSKLWIETGRDSINYGSPVPFELLEGGNKSYRVREQSSTIVVEMLNTGGTTWQQAASLLL